MTDHSSHADAHEDPIRVKFASARRDLSAARIDRDHEIGPALATLAANTDMPLIHPPGTATSR